MRGRSTILSSVAMLALAAAAGEASAQTASDAEADSGAVASSDEIIVTGLRRSDTLQRTPASVSVVTGASLSERDATSYGDYLNTIPSVSYVSNGSYKDKIFIRGVAEGLNARTLSTTGVYIDEAAISEVDSSLADINTFDVERVEVLRGPQGTLYGAGSMGGTVRIITANPVLGETRLFGDTTISMTEDGGISYAVNAGANMSLGENLALRVNGGIRRDGGFVDNIFAPQAAREVNDANHRSARIKLRFSPSSDLEVIASFNYQKSNYDYNSVQDTNRERQVTRRYAEFNNFESSLYGLTITKSLGFAQLVSATNYIDKKSRTGRDVTASFGGAYAGFAGRPLPSNQGLGLLFLFPNKMFSQELRLSSSGTGPFKWIVGGYYSNFKPVNRQFMDVQATPGLAQGNFFTAYNPLSQRVLAAFGELSYEVLSGLEVTAGYRHSDIKGRSEVTLSGFLAGAATVRTDSRYQESAGTQKYRIAYQATPDNLLYAQAAQGFRAGAPLQPFPSTCLAEFQQLGFSQPPTQYDSDRLWQYEVGSKNSFAGGKVSVNASAYYTDWKNMQLARALNCGAQFITNTGKATTKGVELELAARPMDGLRLSLSGAYTNSEMKSSSAVVGAVAGDPLPGVPKWTLSGSTSYRFALTGNTEGYLTGDFSHTSGRYSDFPGLGPIRAPFDPAYTLVNLRAGIDFGAADVALFVTNLFDKNAVVNSVAGNGLFYENIVRPRTIGVNITFGR